MQIAGEVTEWLKVHAWKACVRKYREFESHPLRHFKEAFALTELQKPLIFFDSNIAVIPARINLT